MIKNPNSVQFDHRLCGLHLLLDNFLVTSLAEAVLNEAAILKSRLEMLFKYGSRLELKEKYMKSLEILLHDFSIIADYSQPHGSNINEFIFGGCDGCFLASVGGNLDCISALITCRMIWKRDQSPVEKWAHEWLRICEDPRKNSVPKEARRRAHHVREIHRAMHDLKMYELEKSNLLVHEKDASDWVDGTLGWKRTFELS